MPNLLIPVMPCPPRTCPFAATLAQAVVTAAACAVRRGSAYAEDTATVPPMVRASTLSGRRQKASRRQSLQMIKPAPRAFASSTG
ncbi:hypothetical protein ACFXPI_12830 [Streptomyces sp. NPDC059104]|uniref:hypothetical protein n=1 Tax=Streptomyces sp. NPDC059104 TaxID=3346729 RepID=UPI0036A333C6